MLTQYSCQGNSFYIDLLSLSCFGMERMTGARDSLWRKKTQKTQQIHRQWWKMWKLSVSRSLVTPHQVYAKQLCKQANKTSSDFPARSVTAGNKSNTKETRMIGKMKCTRAQEAIDSPCLSIQCSASGGNAVQERRIHSQLAALKQLILGLILEASYQQTMGWNLKKKKGQPSESSVWWTC